MNDLLSPLRPEMETLTEGVVLLPGFADSRQLAPAIEQVALAAPFRHMVTRGGHAMSAAMTNCGTVGWVTDRAGYRYTRDDPESARPWPAMPEHFRDVACRAAARAGYAGFDPDACLINRYAPGAKMGAHQDRDERDFTQPIVSVSLGLSVDFFWLGAKRSGAALTIPLHDGDVLVFGGTARRGYHGVKPLADAVHPLLGRCRVNLTFRKAL